MTDLVSIRSALLSAEISPLGAELHSLRDAAGRDLQWDGDPAVWNGRAPVLFPVIGVVNGGVIHVDGQAYPMAKHGIVRRRIWTVVTHSEGSATFRFVDDAETRASYPFAFRLDLTFAIEGAALSMTAVLANTGDRPMPASFGFHPALRWPLPDGGDKAAHRIRFDRDEPAPIRRIDGDGMLTSIEHATPVEGRDLALKSELFVDDALIFDDLKSRGLVYGAPGHRGLRVDFADMPELGIWQKPGADYICIEPWAGIADPQGYEGELADKPGVVIVPVGGEHRFAMSIALTD